jgi:hypothetical protein
VVNEIFGTNYLREFEFNFYVNVNLIWVQINLVYIYVRSVTPIRIKLTSKLHEVLSFTCFCIRYIARFPCKFSMKILRYDVST